MDTFFSKWYKQIALALLGFIFLGLGIILSSSSFFQKPKVEVLEEGRTESSKDLKVEISGSVLKPGVYSLPPDSRVEDALILAGGFSEDADRNLVEKVINRAAKLTDGQKIYIPSLNEQSPTASANNNLGYSGGEEEVAGAYSNLVNINTSSQGELEELWGIGPVTAQNIIEQRPYSSVEELLTKKILKTNVYQKIKDQLTIF